MTKSAALSDRQSQWVQATLEGMSIEACAGQLLCPMLGWSSNTESWLGLLKEVPLGAIFIPSMPQAEMRSMLAVLQEHTDIPLLVAGDLERGANAIADRATSFPWTMAAGAANDESLMLTRGQATAIEGRYAGFNWTFSPVVDLNLNFNNPITSIRALSDDPARVIRLVVPLIQAMQANGMMATAKHFPGDGIDDRDQHLMTVLNTLPMEQWWTLFGTVWKAVIDAGVRCIMPGHIALPDYQGYRNNPADAPPATIDSKILQTLLRDELGFEGLIVSDAAPMNGLATRLPPECRVVESIKAGIDVYLFPNTIEDYRHLVNAVKSGDLSEERLRDAARRVLEAKAWLNLHESFFGPEPTVDQVQAFTAASVKQSEKAITVIKQGEKFPVFLPAGANILTVTIGHFNQVFGDADVDVFDTALIERGYQVTHLVNPDNDALRSAARAHDVVFINNITLPFATPGTIRTIIGHFNNWAWRSLFMEHPCVFYTAFGNPYLLYEMPHIPNLMLVFGTSAEQQRAAVRVWTGEIPPQGDLPVKLPTVRVQPYTAL
jgi:beta-N-acetylhexosaminidase